LWIYVVKRKEVVAACSERLASRHLGKISGVKLPKKQLSEKVKFSPNILNTLYVNKFFTR
jgi:hypothetical protein